MLVSYKIDYANEEIMERHLETRDYSAKRLKRDESSNLSDRTLTDHKHGGPNFKSSNKRENHSRLKTFAVDPIPRFCKVFPHFRQPKEVGCFSQDYKRMFKNDASQLRCFYPPTNYDNVTFDLRAGYDKFIKRDETIKTYIDDLLKWILLHKDAFSVHSQKSSAAIQGLSTDFISWRGLYTTLLCTPYENRDGWKIAVIKYKDTFYMCEYDTDEKIEQREHETERQKEMAYWGVKFEQYVTAEPGQQPDTERPVNNSEAFCSITRTRLNNHSLVFGGEVDCYETVDGKKNYIELKTSREIDHPRQLSNFKRFKLLKWWAQSFMIGIKKIVCGFRDDSGVVHRLESFSTLSLPKHCQGIPNCWEPNVCFNFLDQFLQHIKDTITENDPRVAHVFTWYPGEAIRCTCHPPGSQYSFLPDWYIDNI